MNRYIVQQTFRGIATFSVLAETAKEAKEKVETRHLSNAAWEDVEGVDKDVTYIGRVCAVRLDEKDVERLGK